VAGLWEKLKPDRIVRSVYDIDPSALLREGIRGIIADLDNTLVAARETSVDPRLVGWLETLRREGLRVVIVSNNKEARVSAVAEALGVPYVFSARKPLGRSFRRALGLMGLSAEEVAVVGDQLLTDVLGGNRAGLRTILVTPISPEESFLSKMNRSLEKFAVWAMRKRGIDIRGDGS